MNLFGAKQGTSTETRYTAKKERERVRQAEISRTGRDIAPLPPVEKPRRKSRARKSLEIFARTYMPATFTLPFNADHRSAIARIETTVRTGGTFAVALPRASGKTCLIEAGALWALLYGFRRFVVIVGPDQTLAVQLLDGIKQELQSNEILFADFPEVIHSVRRLEGIPLRARGQLFDGQRTHIEWTNDQVVLPTIPGSKASSAVLRVCGITGRIRGQRFTRPDGSKVRPDLVLIDDPQTDESAASPTQTDARESVIDGAVLGLAGPKKKIAALMTCTIIRPGDLAARFLDHNRHPEWQGQRSAMVYSWPTNEDLWRRYVEIRGESLRQGRNGDEATAFYRDHREAMDKGAVVSWPQRFNEDELSALQHAWNLRMQDESAFFAEYQNEPLLPETAGLAVLSAEAIAARCNGISQGTAPVKVEHITGAIDLHDDLLFWLVIGWARDYTGFLLAYGAYPQQTTRIFTLRRANPTIGSIHPGGREASIRAALFRLTSDLAGRTWPREDGTTLRTARVLIDSGYIPEVAHDAAQHAGYSAILLPSRGIGVGAVSRPMDEWQLKPGERRGQNWLLTRTADRATRAIRFDANHWKTFLHTRLAVPLGDPGSLSLYGNISGEHQLLAEHLTAEVPVLVSARGRTVQEWSMRPGVADNHWLDTGVLCAVAASEQGCQLEGQASVPPSKPIKLSEVLQQKRRARGIF